MENQIKKLLEEKLEKVRVFDTQTRKVSDALAKKDIQGLFKILDYRQELIKDIDIVDTKLLAFFKENVDSFKTYISRSSSELKKTHSNTEALLRKVQALDEKNKETANGLFAKLKNDMENLRKTENALKGYGIIGKRSDDGAFIDTKK